MSLDRLTATDRETLRVLGHALATVKDLAETLGIGNTAAYQRLERLRSRGILVRHEQAGTRAALYEVHDPAGRAAALVSAVSQELPPAEAAAFARMVTTDGHRCVACGIAHGNCCGLCPQWIPLPGEVRA
jgi:predicted ArsR family transcriptional regulator